MFLFNPWYWGPRQLWRLAWHVTAIIILVVELSVVAAVFYGGYCGVRGLYSLTFGSRPTTTVSATSVAPPLPSRTPGYNVRWTASAASKPWADVLEGLVKDGRESKRNAIRYTLKIRKPELCEVIVPLLVDREVGKEAHDALVVMGKDLDPYFVRGKTATIETLAKALEEGPILIKVKAGICLRDIGKPSIDRLIKCLDNENKTVCTYAQQILFNIRGSKDALEKAFHDDHDASVSVAAEQVLEWLKLGKIPDDVLRDTEAAREAKAKADEEAVRAATEARLIAKLQPIVVEALEASEQRAKAREARLSADIMSAARANGDAQRQLEKTLNEVKSVALQSQAMMPALQSLINQAEAARQAPPIVTVPVKPKVASPPACNGRYCPNMQYRRW